MEEGRKGQENGKLKGKAEGEGQGFKGPCIMKAPRFRV